MSKVSTSIILEVKELISLIHEEIIKNKKTIGIIKEITSEKYEIESFYQENDKLSSLLEGCELMVKQLTEDAWTDKDDIEFLSNINNRVIELKKEFAKKYGK